MRRIIRGERQDVFRTRQGSLEAHLPWLDAQWSSGCRNGAELWRRLKEQGFRGSLRVVTEWSTRRRRSEKADAQNLQRIPSARTIARLMTIGRHALSKAETVTIAAIENGVPSLVEAREFIAAFQAMIRSKVDAELTAWIGRPARACWRRSPAVSLKTKPQCAPRSPSHGRTDRRKVRSPSSSWSNAKCVAGRRLISSRLA